MLDPAVPKLPTALLFISTPHPHCSSHTTYHVSHGGHVSHVWGCKSKTKIELSRGSKRTAPHQARGSHAESKFHPDPVCNITPRTGVLLRHVHHVRRTSSDQGLVVTLLHARNLSSSTLCLHPNPLATGLYRLAISLYRLAICLYRLTMCSYRLSIWLHRSSQLLTILIGLDLDIVTNKASPVTGSQLERSGTCIRLVLPLPTRAHAKGGGEGR